MSGETEKERERQRVRERETQRGRKIDRERKRKIDRERDRKKAPNLPYNVFKHFFCQIYVRNNT